MEQLDGDFTTTEAMVFTTVDDGHTAASDPFQDLVTAGQGLIFAHSPSDCRCGGGMLPVPTIVQERGCPHFYLSFRCSSSTCTGSTVVGLSHIRSVALCVFGNAMTSRGSDFCEQHDHPVKAQRDAAMW